MRGKPEHLLLTTEAYRLDCLSSYLKLSRVVADFAIRQCLLKFVDLGLSKVGIVEDDQPLQAL